MKLVSITAFTLLCTAQLDASPARTQNQRLQSALTDINSNCKYPTSLNNEADYDKFFTCVYSKYAAEKVTSKKDDLEQVKNRVKLAWQRNSNNPELRKKRIKAILVNNADKFGLTKKEVHHNISKYQFQVEKLINNMDIEGMKKKGDITVNQVVDMGSNMAESYLDQGKELMEQYPEASDVLTNFWNSWSKSAQGQQAIGMAKGYMAQGKSLAKKNGNKSLAEVAVEVAKSDGVQDFRQMAEEKVDEIMD